MYFSLHKSMHVLLMACVHCLWPFLTQEVNACTAYSLFLTQVNACTSYGLRALLMAFFDTGGRCM